MKNLMEQVLNQISDHKAEGDLIYSSSKTLKMSAQKNALSTYNVSSSQILGIRVIKEGKVGLSYTESLDEESLRYLVKQALQNAEITEASEHEQILSLSGSLVDELVVTEDDVAIDVKTEKALLLERAVRNLDPRVTSVPYNSYSEQDYSSYYLSSAGRSTSYKDKSYSITTSSVMEENGKKSSFYDFHMAHRFSDLNFKKVIDNAFFHSKNLLTEKTLPSGRYHIRFSEDCLQSLFNCFSNFYSAKAAMDQMNPWASQQGQAVISKDLTIVDDPMFERSFRTNRFDSEGVERAKLKLIEHGELKSFYHNSVTANYFNTTTTGHASRSAGGPLGVSGTDLVITGKNIQPLPGKYLEVIQMDGLYSGANRVTGAFSVAIKGYVWEQGERRESFGNITLSGKITDLLNHVAVTDPNLLASTDMSFFSVPLIFFDVSVAGT